LRPLGKEGVGVGGSTIRALHGGPRGPSGNGRVVLAIYGISHVQISASMGKVEENASTFVEYAGRDAQKVWRQKSAASRSMNEVSSDFDGWTSRPDVKLRGVPRMSRAKNTLNVQWARRLGSARATATSLELRENLWCDLSQCVARKTAAAGSSFGLPGILCTSGLWYSFAADATLDGTDFCCPSGVANSDR
jgi:hypothetical protein